jgi:ankyrin repeat protein/Flp pilus assembly protein TadD
VNILGVIRRSVSAVLRRSEKMAKIDRRPISPSRVRERAQLLLAVFGLASLTVCHGRDAWSQGQASSAEYAKLVYESTDEVLDDVRTAPAGAMERANGVLAQLETAITKYPDSALLQTAMGRALIIRDCAMLGNNCSVRAKGHLTKAIELDPKLVRAHVLLAHDAINSGCLPCALPHIRTARPLEPNNPYLLEVLARFSQLSGNEDEAEKRYLQAIEAFPTSKKRWQAYTWLSEIYKRRSDYERAERALMSAKDSAPDGAWPMGNLGTFYIFALGDYDKATPLLRQALSIMSYGNARQGLALSLYERWADAYLKKSDQRTLKAYWEEAQEESSDAQSMFFISASYHGTGRAARALLDSARVPRSVLEQPWDQGRTPLLMAAGNDNTDLSIYLIQRGANPNARDPNGIFVAHVAGSWANLKILEALRKKNANLKVLTQEARETVLMQVAKASKTRPGKIKAAALLIDKGVPIEAKSAHGMTALGYAIGAHDVEMVRYLLSRGARVNGELAGGMTPASLAIFSGDRKILEALIAKNVDLNAKVSGMTLIEFAESNGRPEMAEMLRSRK